MTGTIADVDVLALAVDGLTFRTERSGTRVAVVCADDRGAVELWKHDVDLLPASVRNLDSVREVGGVEIHAAGPWPDQDRETAVPCEVLPGGRCWPGGVSLVGSPFPGLIEAGDSAEVLRLLAERHRAAFGGTR